MPAGPYTSALAESLAGDVLERLCRYVRIDTQSRRDRTASPSTPGQLDLSRLLVEELLAIGIDDAELDENGYVRGTLRSGAAGEAPRIEVPAVGLVAHVDTTPDACGRGVEPLVHRDYAGGPIELPRGSTRLDPAAMPELADKVGHDLVTGSGDTIHGADDKAGVAAIMAAVAHLSSHPELPRPTLRICFTPDEEIGEGATLFDIERFGADCAYTIDGGALGELQDESFNALEVIVTVHGTDLHPGRATGKLVNALRLVARILAALPSDRLTPETTSGREGFIHPFEITGSVARANLRAIIRDFDSAALDEHLALVRRTAEEVMASEPRASMEVTVHEQYRNMRRYLEGAPHVIAAAETAMRAEGIEPVRKPIRGGTDGSRLSEMGLPTPNIFTGGYEFHSFREWASVQEMAASAATIVRLAEVWSWPETAALAPGYPTVQGAR